MRIAVTGASGLIGSALVQALTADGHEVLRLVRREPRASDERRWDPPRGAIDAGALEGIQAAVHLAGDNIAAGRWTAAKKARLRASRLGPTRLLAEALAGLARKPAVLVSSSAIGYYGDRGDAWLREQDAPAEDFLGRLSVEWEAATAPAAQAGIRVVPLRTGIVLSGEGGALARMLLPFRLGLGGVLASGRQYFSWIALDDQVDAIRHVIAHDELSGPVNAVAPGPVTNAELTRTLGRVLGRPTLLPVPAFGLRIVLGEMAEAALASARVRPERLLASGFRFRFPELEGALRHVLSRPGPPAGTPPRPAA
jgi:uncharacterized protein (TIGR01777 family)